jgi:hypothetical protein
MRNIIFILFCFLSAPLNAIIYYCSPIGNDASADPTNIVTPWKTWHYAFNNVTPTDTVYFRGGVYPAYSTSIGAIIATTAVDGTYSQPTCFFAYPADFAAKNYPILDCQTMTNVNNYGVAISRASHIYFKGLFVRNVRQTTTAFAFGWYIWSEAYTNQYAPNNIKFENCVAHNVGGTGFNASVYDTIYFVNCDGFNCVDSLSVEPGGTGQAFRAGPRQTSYINAEFTYAYLHGCRAWTCSDQGYSLASEGVIVSDSCWAINNGNTPFPENITTMGSGWKLWFNGSIYKNINVIQIVIRNCIAAYNAFAGINWTDHNTPSIPEIRAHIYNNFIYNNTYQVEYKGTPWGYNITDDVNTDSTGAWDHWYWNNISYVNPYRRDELDGIYNEATNKFNVVGTSISDADFVSLDTTGMMGIHEREANWSLPITTFGHLASTSECINAGTDVGLPYFGDAPDIGWIEYDFGESENPLVATTYAPYNVTSRYGTASGTVTYDGGLTVTRGFCWDTSTDPEKTDNSVTVGTGTGVYTSSITGLLPNTTYYLRAWVTNDVATAYGENQVFTTDKWNYLYHGGKIVTHNGKPVIVR